MAAETTGTTESADSEKLSWFKRMVISKIQAALEGAADVVSVNAADVVKQTQAMGFGVKSLEDIAALSVDKMAVVAVDSITGYSRMGALTGAGWGIGGLPCIAGDLASLAVLNLRLVQKISCSYGFSHLTDAGKSHVWIAMAAAMGVEGIEAGGAKILIKSGGKYILKTPYSKMVVLSFIREIAKRMGITLTKKMFVQALPFFAAAIAAPMNYGFTKANGLAAQLYFKKLRENLNSTDAGPAST